MKTRQVLLKGRLWQVVHTQFAKHLNSYIVGSANQEWGGAQLI